MGEERATNGIGHTMACFGRAHHANLMWSSATQQATSGLGSPDDNAAHFSVRFVRTADLGPS